MHNIPILGKIIFLLSFPIIAFAQLTASVDKSVVDEGQSITLTLKTSGDNIVFPNLRTVEGNKVISTNKTSSIIIKNNTITKEKTISYKFIPKYSFRIPIYSSVVNGIEEYSEPIRIKVKKDDINIFGKDIVLDVNFSKTTAYVGEAILVTFKLKYKNSYYIVKTDTKDFYINHFDIQEQKEIKSYKQDDYMIKKKKFLLFPNLAGEYIIPKLLINVAMLEDKTNRIKWYKIVSKEKKLNILSLPSNIDIQGNFKIIASVDKNTTIENKPINLKIKVSGSGNIKDIDSFKIELKDAVVYSTKPIITTKFTNDIYKGEFIQNISIIADENFTIPSISFRYFDKNKKTIVSIKTKSIDIKVKKSPIKNYNKYVKQKIIYKTEDSYIKYIFAFVGLIFGIFITFFALKPKKIKKDEKSLELKIKKSKNNKELYTILLPYANNNKIVKIINDLEKNIYTNEKNKINKKELINLLEDEKLL